MLSSWRIWRYCSVADSKRLMNMRISHSRKVRKKLHSSFQIGRRSLFWLVQVLVQLVAFLRSRMIRPTGLIRKGMVAKGTPHRFSPRAFLKRIPWRCGNGTLTLWGCRIKRFPARGTSQWQDSKNTVNRQLVCKRCLSLKTMMICIPRKSSYLQSCLEHLIPTAKWLIRIGKRFNHMSTRSMEIWTSCTVVMKMLSTVRTCSKLHRWKNLKGSTSSVPDAVVHVTPYLSCGVWWCMMVCVISALLLSKKSF